MKNNKKTNKKTIGLVLLIIGIIGLFGSFSEGGFSVETALGSACFIAVGIVLFLSEKKQESSTDTATTPQPQPTNQEVKEVKTNVIPDGEKDYNLIPDYDDGKFLAYKYEESICFIKDDNPEEKFGYVIGNGGKQLLFEFEPENQYDTMAVAIYLDDKKLGYVYSGRTQEMIHDFYRKGWEVCAHINKYSIEKKTATYKIGFFKPIERFESKQFSLVKTTKRIDEYSNRADNLSFCEEGDVLTIECEGLEDNYIVYADGYREIGELPKSAVNFIEEYNPKKIMGILNSCEEDENGKLKAKITIYLI